jgi:hypothetical protein
MRRPARCWKTPSRVRTPTDFGPVDRDRQDAPAPKCSARDFRERASELSGAHARIREHRQESTKVAERGEFELRLRICEQPDDGIRLGFATSRRTAKRCRPWRISSALWGRWE